MNTSGRFAVTSLASIVAFYAGGWFGFLAWVMATKPFRGSVEDYTAEALVQSTSSFVAAALAGWYTWRWAGAAHKPSRGVLAMTIRWALIVGGIGFALGFFGPIIFMPGANQGPLLGIFITGPLGFVVGGVIGFVRSLRGEPQAISTVPR